MVKMVITCMNLFRKYMQEKASKPHCVKIQFCYKLPRFLTILHSAFHTLPRGKSLPITISTPYLRSQIFNLFKLYQKNTQRTTPATIDNISMQKNDTKKSPAVRRLSLTWRVAFDVVNPLSVIFIIKMEQKMKIPGHIIEKRKELQKKLVESGEMERLEEYLRKKLISSGWKQNLKSYCKDLVREKGIQKVTVQSLVEELEMRGKHTIPVTIREDLLSRVRKFLQQNK